MWCGVVVCIAQGPQRGALCMILILDIASDPSVTSARGSPPAAVLGSAHPDGVAPLPPPDSHASSFDSESERTLTALPPHTSSSLLHSHHSSSTLPHTTAPPTFRSLFACPPLPVRVLDEGPAPPRSRLATAWKLSSHQLHARLATAAEGYFRFAYLLASRRMSGD